MQKHKNVKMFFMIAVSAMLCITVPVLAGENFDVYAVCDPVNEGLTNYVLIIDGGEPIEVPAHTLEDGRQMLKHLISSLPDGEHHFQVAAENIWGRSDFVPWNFSKALPSLPEGLRPSR